mgnify:CR=1 FL=1
MIENNLNIDIDSFLNKYYSFKEGESQKAGYLALEGKISILDKQYKLWGHFEIIIFINEKEYPYTIPIVVEKTKVINRDWDFHISKDGVCCLDIPHKLLRKKDKEYNLKNFTGKLYIHFLPITTTRNQLVSTLMGNTNIILRA